MAIFIGGISSLHFWRTQSRPLPLGAFALHEFDSLPAPRRCDVTSIDEELRTVLGEPLHVYVGEERKRRHISGVRFHVLSGHAAPGWFAQAAPGVFIARPELCFAQTAEELSPLQLVKWGMELCGRYRFDEQRGALDGRVAPLTSARAIRDFLLQYEGKPGARRAARAARWIMDGSASLRESQLALHFRIPRRAGGNGLGVPLLNHRIELDRDMQSIAGRICYYADQYWPNCNLVVEYESDAYHGAPAQAAEDRKRRNILQRCGFRVITVNTRQLTNLRETDDIAAQILEHMNRRQQSLGREWDDRHRAFHRELLRFDRRLLL